MENRPSSVVVLMEGARAFFPRPEFRRDSITYESLTPAAARGILDTIHWMPSIRWIVDRIHVRRPIQLEMLESSRAQQNRMLILKDVVYIVEAHFEWTDRAEVTDDHSQHLDSFRAAVARSNAFFGRKDFPATTRLLENGSVSSETISLNHDFGWLLHGADYSDRGRLRFFRARAFNGMIDVPPPGSPELFG